MKVLNDLVDRANALEAADLGSIPVSGQTKQLKTLISIHSFLLDAQHQREVWSFHLAW